MSEQIDISATHRSSVPDVALGGRRTPGVWGPWATLAWGAGGLAVMLAAQLGAIVLALIVGLVSMQEIGSEAGTFSSDATLIYVSELVTAPLVVAYFAFAAWLSGVPPRDYLALRWPTLRQSLIGLGVIVAAVIAGDLVIAFVGDDGASPFMGDMVQSARDPVTVALLVLAVVVAAPISEEITFRAFMLPGLARGWGDKAAILGTAILWSALHIQYDLALIVFWVFALGIALGWVRTWSRSTTLTILLHSAVNLFGMTLALTLQS